jgi:hypothetical protein
MGESQLSDGINIRQAHSRPPFIGGQSRSRLVDGQISAESLGPLASTAGAEGVENLGRHDHRWQEFLSLDDLPPFETIGRIPAITESDRIGLEREPSPDDLRAAGGVGHRLDLDGQAKAVEQLRAKVALLRVHCAYKYKPGWMAEGQALALDMVHAHRRDVEQKVDQVVGQKVDLVNVKQPSMSPGQQARLESAEAGGKRPFDVEGANHAVVGRAHRQVDEFNGALDDPRPFEERPAFDLLVNRSMKRVALVNFDGRKDLGECSNRRTLGRAFGPSDQDSAQPWIDGRERQGSLHRTLTDDRREWVRTKFIHASGALASGDSSDLARRDDGLDHGCLVHLLRFS